MKRYFITGTDTDCGKTWVTSKLLEFISDATAIKPVASGGQWINGELVSLDAIEIQKRTKMPLHEINPWIFETPVSPHIAAEMEGQLINVKEIAQYVLEFDDASHQILLVEGAGGLMVPLNATETWIDFLQLTQIPLILVVGMKLGCINHALLTQAAIELHNLQCVGWIANFKETEFLAGEQNLMTLKRKLKFPLLARMNHGEGVDDYYLDQSSCDQGLLSIR